VIRKVDRGPSDERRRLIGAAFVREAHGLSLGRESDFRDRIVGGGSRRKRAERLGDRIDHHAGIEIAYDRDLDRAARKRFTESQLELLDLQRPDLFQARKHPTSVVASQDRVGITGEHPIRLRAVLADEILRRRLDPREAVGAEPRIGDRGGKQSQLQKQVFRPGATAEAERLGADAKTHPDYLARRRLLDLVLGEPTETALAQHEGREQRKAMLRRQRRHCTRI
jgi:hypothetical protein